MLNNNLVVETKDIAKAIKALSGLLIKPEQLIRIQVTDSQGEVTCICPRLITLIATKEFYHPTERSGSEIHYINGHVFTVDLPPTELEKHTLNIATL